MSKERLGYSKHKVECVSFRVDDAIYQAKQEMESRPLSSYTFRPCIFGSSEAQRERGEIVEEEKAQSFNYDSWETTTPTAKGKALIKALNAFPWSTDTWCTLGWYFKASGDNDLPKEFQNLQKAKELFQLGIKSARKLNPTWGPDRLFNTRFQYIFTKNNSDFTKRTTAANRAVDNCYTRRLMNCLEYGLTITRPEAE